MALMLTGDVLRVVIVTTHVPLGTVKKLITHEQITIIIQLTHRWLLEHVTNSPKIAVTGLNPHCGDGGIFGEEELTIIIPALDSVRKEGIKASGPFSADALFAKLKPNEYDAVITMYHDQGMIPVKMANRGTAVNVTLGLPIIRTSVDHGTAFDIAGKGCASAESLKIGHTVSCTTGKTYSQTPDMKKQPLGQNYLIDEGVAHEIIKQAGVTSDQNVLEIGPGRGILTALLLEKAKSLTAIEIDSRLCSFLIDRFGKCKNFQLIKEDALKYDYSSLAGWASDDFQPTLLRRNAYPQTAYPLSQALYPYDSDASKGSSRPLSSSPRYSRLCIAFCFCSVLLRNRTGYGSKQRIFFAKTKN